MTIWSTFISQAPRGRELSTFLRSHWKGHCWDGDLGHSYPVLDSKYQLPKRPELTPVCLGALAWTSPSLGIPCWPGCLVTTRETQGSPPRHFRRFAPNSEPITHTVSPMPAGTRVSPLCWDSPGAAPGHRGLPYPYSVWAEQCYSSLSSIQGAPLRSLHCGYATLRSLGSEGWLQGHTHHCACGPSLGTSNAAWETLRMFLV